jgi:uncharacterized protein YkwD
LSLEKRGQQVLGCILLSAALLWYLPQSRQPDFFLSLDNGDGGPGWVIGKVQTERHELGKERALPELQRYALQLVNRDRQLNGLSTLTEDPLLSLAAQRHAEDMLTRQFYAHVNPDGQNPSDRFQAVGGQQGAGENISQWKGGRYTHASFGLVEELQKGWMYSDGHRQNLLTPDYKTFGYGVVTARNGQEIYAVQLFSY